MLVETLCAAVGFWIVFIGLLQCEQPAFPGASTVIFIFTVFMSVMAVTFTADAASQITGVSSDIMYYIVATIALAIMVAWKAWLSYRRRRRARAQANKAEVDESQSTKK